MEHGFTWVSVIPGLNALPPQTATGLLVAVALAWWAMRARAQIEAAGTSAVVPDERLSARNAMEVFVVGFSSLVTSVIGSHGRRYFSVYATFFLFILASNLAGLIPGFSPPTSNVNVTLSLGVLSFIFYNYYGLREHGLAYLKHFLGPIWWLAPLMLPLELIDNLVRPITLNLRLLMNMFADHMVLELFTDLTKVIIPVVFLALGTLVSIIQAFVFTILSLVYVALAVGGHEEH